ncbi:MAG: endonuclease/exonuclease/phosphatase family protein [Candidatus Peregrinibacteria bacterium]
MKILLYNIGCGTGLNGSWRQYFLKGWRYLWFSKKVLKKIIHMLRRERADIVCLLETDIGSFRNRFHSQVNEMVKALGLPFYKTFSSYNPRSLWTRLPVFRKQHAGMMSGTRSAFEAHYIKTGMKRLVGECVVGDKSVFVLHLSLLSKRSRAKQLKEIGSILRACPRPYVVCGDFNIFKGLSEVREFMERNQLQLVKHEPSFPSFRPKRPIDLFLISNGIEVKKAGVVRSELSDHLPMWVEI